MQHTRRSRSSTSFSSSWARAEDGHESRGRSLCVPLRTPYGRSVTFRKDPDGSHNITTSRARAPCARLTGTCQVALEALARGNNQSMATQYAPCIAHFLAEGTSHTPSSSCSLARLQPKRIEQTLEHLQVRLACNPTLLSRTFVTLQKR